MEKQQGENNQFQTDFETMAWKSKNLQLKLFNFQNDKILSTGRPVHL